MRIGTRCTLLMCVDVHIVMYIITHHTSYLGCIRHCYNGIYNRSLGIICKSDVHLQNIDAIIVGNKIKLMS